ncbi:MAG: YncE family protein [Muribaculaceae bacterium]|nr:YncE family protein [Muribaculaceae bacterium]
MFSSCSEEDPEIPDVIPTGGVDFGPGGDVIGIYVLNEGNMGSNKCTLDYYDYTTQTYYQNIYAQNNPDVVMELGDSGNDIAVHDGRLYIVVGGSHKVEVLDAYTAKRIGQVDISSPRSLAFRGDSVMVSSFVDVNGGSNGSVVWFDANTLEVKGQCTVGIAPEEMVVADGKLYVANSADFNTYAFDNTISVVDLNSFALESSIDLGSIVNLHHLRLDNYGNMWVTARGNYADKPSALARLAKNEAGEYALAETTPYGCANLALGNGMLYFYEQNYDASYNATYNFDALRPTATGYDDMHADFINDVDDIATPYALAVQPSNGDIFVTDVKDYTSSGELRCYTPAGTLRTKVTTGDIPGHIAFLVRR